MSLGNQSASVAPQPITPLQSAATDAEVSLGRYDSLLDRLEIKMAHLLTPMPKADDGTAPGLTEAGRSQFHEDLLSLGRRATSLNDRFDSILNRIVA